MEDFWEYPTVSMGLGPSEAIYQAWFDKYLQGAGIKDTSQQHTWAFLGDGEMDEPESRGMLQLARRRAATARCEVELLQADGAQLPFGDETFDAVVCTFSLCGFPDPRAGVKDMVRVLRPGGSLLLADHVGSTNPLIRLGQWALQAITIPTEGEHWTRRPKRYVEALALPVIETGRLHHGIIERLHASREAR